MNFLGPAIRSVTSLSLFGLVLIVVLDVIGRSLFNSPLKGGVELTETLLAFLVFLSLPQANYYLSHIVVDLLPLPNNKLAKSIQAITIQAICLAIFLSLSWQLSMLAERSASYQETTGELGIPLSTIIYYMSTMCLLSGIINIINIIKTILKNKKLKYGAPK